MKCNVGRTERIIRIIIGLMIMGAGVYFDTWWGAVGMLPLLTATIAWCPVSSLLGISTCKDENEMPADTSAGDSKKPMRIREL
ncbi:MAG TPA: DUF2892 domain-containing protein [Desulfobacterales bacterium]|nr:DUF2892 domain-containing protein [Desulfobacterales bacterium]